jgi:hypothetical protein
MAAVRAGAAIVAMGLAGCAFRQGSPQSPPLGGGGTGAGLAVEGRVGLLQPELAHGVSPAVASCDRSAPEVWNGLDDDCDAEIDEAFVSAGPIQVTLYWETDADIDLSVVDPVGNVVSWRSPQAATGGYLDRDARGACGGGETARGENVVWATPMPPVGQYHVVLDYYEDCRGVGETDTTFSVSVDGRIVGAYRYRLEPDGHGVTVATFGVP